LNIYKKEITSAATTSGAGGAPPEGP